MRIFFAFSTGAMLGRLLVKMLGRKDVDVTNMNEMRSKNREGVFFNTDVNGEWDALNLIRKWK